MMILTSVETVNGGFCMLSITIGTFALNLDPSSCPILMYISDYDTHIIPQYLPDTNQYHIYSHWSSRLGYFVVSWVVTMFQRNIVPPPSHCLSYPYNLQRIEI